MSYVIKILITVSVVIAASEIAKRSSALGAAIVALPITSMIAMCFLYYDSKDAAKVAEFSRSIPLAIIPSVAFFYCFSFLIDGGFSFAIAMLLSALLMLGIYALYLFFSTRIGM